MFKAFAAGLVGIIFSTTLGVIAATQPVMNDGTFVDEGMTRTAAYIR